MSKYALALVPMLCIPALGFPHLIQKRDVVTEVVTITVTGYPPAATPAAPAIPSVNSPPVDAPSVDDSTVQFNHKSHDNTGKPKPQDTTDSSKANTPSSQPFSRIVAFGDNLSDNGNGSVAHCVAAPGDCDNSIYGANTWTDGPVAVEYLATNLGGLPLLDFAYGHADGGSKFGATIDNSFTQSSAGAPSSKDQIANYTSDPRGDISDSLHFLWIGANDINLYHIMTWFAENHEFGDQFAALLSGQIQTLLDAGAKYIFVPNLYPKQLSPSSEFYASDTVGKQSLTDAIVYANQQIKSAVDKFGPRVLYYDVYDMMMGLWDNGPSYGFTKLQGQFCDGFTQQDWDLCVTDGQGHLYYWMQFLDPTTYVHQHIAEDMAKAIQAHSWS